MAQGSADATEALRKPLSDEEVQRLGDMLDQIDTEWAMNLEMVDGFFAALVCSPSTVLPREYLPEIWGGAELAFDTDVELQECIGLLMRHWNGVVRKLDSGEVFLPLLFEDDAGEVQGNDWAEGFLSGMDLRKSEWRELLDDDDHAGNMMAIFALAYEHDPDPDMRPYAEPVDDDRRLDLIAGVAVGVMNIYRYFAPHRRREARLVNEAKTYRRSASKVGRNAPCPCGSGKKFKRCCGRNTSD